MKRVGSILLVTLLLLVGGFLLGPRLEVGPPEDFDAPPSLTALHGWLAAREAAFDDLTPGAEARIVWADPTNPQRTPLAIVQFHGFSATPPETSPFAETIAAELGANLYQVRLRGHGRGGEPLAQASVEQWYADALQALAIGRTIGEKVALVGTSTGGSLAIWLAARPEADGVVDRLVLVSPNLGIADPRGALLTGPWGLQIAEATVGPIREWTPQTAERRRFWTWRYPTRALLTMMALVDAVAELPPDAIAAPTLVFYSPLDTVLDPDAIVAWVDAADNRSAIVVEDDGPADDHVLVGDICAPQRTARLAARAVQFLGEPAANPAAGDPR